MQIITIGIFKILLKYNKMNYKTLDIFKNNSSSQKRLETFVHEDINHLTLIIS